MSRRRIELVSPPFAGHLHPLLAIGRALTRDHDITVLSTEAALPRITAAGLHAEIALPGIDADVSAIVDQPRAIGANPFGLHRQFRLALALLARMHEALGRRWRHQRPDLVIGDFTLPVVGPAADAALVPWWTSVPAPAVVDTPDGPPPYFGGLEPARTSWQRLRNALGRTAIRTFKRTVHWLYRRRIRPLGLPAVYRRDGTEAIYSPTCILALGLEELEFPRRWPAAMQFVGPLLYTPPSQHAPPPFRVGRKAVLVTLGTHLRFHKDAFARTVQQVATTLPEIDFHFTDGDVAATGSAVGAGNYHRVPFVDYDLHLPRYQLVVHHAGTGVMYHTLRAGLPSISCPVDYDQFDQAARLARAGVTLWCRKPAELLQLLPRALADDELRASCNAWQRRLAQLDPGRRVADMVAAHFARRQ